MSDFKIEKSIPLPANKDGRGGSSKYPHAELNVGESFFVPLDGLIRQTMMGRMSGAARAETARTGNKFINRSVEEEQGAGVRVWRTA